MSLITTLDINTIPKTYCYRCKLNNVNTTLVDKAQSYSTCPIDGCTCCVYSSVASMYYCEMHNILFELSHPHSVMETMANVYYVNMITDYTYNAVSYVGMPVFESLIHMETELTNETFAIVDKKCFCHNTTLCSMTIINDDINILVNCNNTF